MRKAALLFFPAALLALAAAWYANHAWAEYGSWFAGGWAGRAMAFGRLAGVLAFAGVCLQLLLMSRAVWAQGLTGGALPVKWHHRLGLLIPAFVIAHPPLMAWSRSLDSGSPFGAEYLLMIAPVSVKLAGAAALLLLASAAFSTDLLRRLLPGRSWYYLHLGAYAALALAAPHAALHGFDFEAARPVFAAAWYGLLAFALGNSVYYRLFKRGEAA